MQKIWIVDAFTNEAYKGNPAAVMIVDEFPGDMQEIASEMNLPETSFVKQLSQNHYHIRWFSPVMEMRLVGHATLAAAHVLFQENLIVGKTITFKSLSGDLVVTQKDDGLVLDFPLQKTSEGLDETIFEFALNLFGDEIIEVVRAHDDALVIVKDESIVKNLKPNFSALANIDYVRGTIVSARGSSFDFVSRVFFPRFGVNEDPVCGSAHCRLAFYWGQKLKKTTFRAYQASARGGILDIEIHGERVHLKGNAVTIMEGLWKVQCKQVFDHQMKKTSDACSAVN